jgi:DHA2 family multidrug resistance protein-like MFS transporter
MATPPLARRVRPSVLMSVGLVVSAIGYAMLTALGPSTGFVLFGLATFILSFGASPVFTLTTDLIIGSAPPERAGAASGISETSAELGGALGIALFGSIGVAVYRSLMPDPTALGIPAGVGAAASTLGGAVELAGQVSADAGRALVDAARVAFVHGLRLCAALSAIGSVALAVFALATLRSVGRGTGAAKGSSPATSMPAGDRAVAV